MRTLKGLKIKQLRNEFTHAADPGQKPDWLVAKSKCFNYSLSFAGKDSYPYQTSNGISFPANQVMCWTKTTYQCNKIEKMKKAVLQFYNFIVAKSLSPILKLEQKKRPFPVINERATEYSFTLRYIQKLCAGKLLDIGSGKSSWPHLLSICGIDVKAIDKMDEYWNSYFNRHYKIHNDDITNPKTKEKFQFATCLSVLEHIPDHRVAMINIHDLIETNGYLVLTFPFNENIYDKDIYKHPDAGYGQNANFITQVFSREEINCWLSDTSFEIIDQEYYKVFTGEMWTMGDRVTPCELTTSSALHHLTCILFQKKGK